MDQLATQAEQNLVSVMHDLNDGMQSAVDRFIVQYLAGKPDIAYSDLAQTLQPAELRRYRDAVNRLKLDGVPQTEAAAKLANASKKVSRIDALINELSQWLNNGAAGIQRVIDPQLQATYDVEKTLRAGAMEGAGIGVSFTKNSPYQLRSVVSQRWLGSSYSDRVWKQKDVLLEQLAKSLPQMFIAGADNNAIAKELQRVTGVNQSAANRLIRTEGAKVATQADNDLYRDAGLDTYVYMATIDGRTSEICRQMNGKTLEVTNLKPGVTAPPLHPNCRSTTVPDVDTSDIDEVSVLEAEEAVAKKYGGIARPRNAQGVIVVDTPDVISKRLRSARAAKE
jgi:SPP1 gp7 family putative phage head morphogenesis protein